MPGIKRNTGTERTVTEVTEAEKQEIKRIANAPIKSILAKAVDVALITYCGPMLPVMNYAFRRYMEKKGYH